MAGSKDYIFHSVKGSRNKENWDDILISDNSEYSIYAVFDGISSAINGKEAGFYAKDFILTRIQDFRMSQLDLKQLLFNLNSYLIESKIDEPYSTFCILLHDKVSDHFRYSWLGDSRLYEVSNQYIELLTEDDSYSENFVTKFLGKNDLILEDFRDKCIEGTNRHFLLCTDGFYRLLEQNKLHFFDYFQKKTLKAARRGILDLINGRNSDDCTFIFIK